MDTKGGWSEVPLDIIFLVVSQKKLSLGDVGRMTSVCKSWRSILQENNWFGLRIIVNIGETPFPWLMLAESTSCNGDKRGFYNPATRQVCEVYLPEAKGRRCCGSSHGWIVTMGEDMAINLLNPLTREQLNLPSQLTFIEFEWGITNDMLHEEYTKRELLSIFITKAILTRSPSKGECVVVAVLAAEVNFQVVFARPGDHTWTLVPPFYPGLEEDYLAMVEDLLFYEGKLFCITNCADLMVLDLYDNPEHGWEVISSNLNDTYIRGLRPTRDEYPHFKFNFYLVQIAGEFVVIARGKERKGKNSYQTQKIAVFKLLIHKGEWCQINEIANCCLFLGTNESTCLSPTPRGCCPNCIYFTDDFYFVPGYHTIAGHDMVVYSMENNEFTPIYDVEILLSEISPSLWVTLTSC